eukprot:6196881-Pleurochrysis_carterae.AAC.3
MGAASDERGACELHHGSDGPFSHSIQLMHMRRKRSAMNSAACKKIVEFCRHKFACIIGV